METRLTRTALALVAALACVAAAPPTATASGTFDAAVAAAKADMLVDPGAVFADADRAEAVARRERDSAERDRKLATVSWLRGEAHMRKGDYARALPVLADADALAKRIAPRSALYADILLAYGSALTDTGRITAALPALQHAHDLFQSNKQSRGQAKALILLAILYESALDHPAALRYFGRAIDTYRQDPGLLIAIYNGRGSALLAVGRQAEAEADFVRAAALARQLGSDGAEAIALGNVANARLGLARIDGADAAIAHGLALTHRPGAAIARPSLLRFAAESALRRHNLERARKLIAERFRDVDLATTILPDRDAHETAYRIYSASGDTALAIAHLTALKRLDDQATEVARSNSAALASARFDYANQELRIAKLKGDDLQKTVAFERATARTQRAVFIGAGVATALLVALLAFGLFTIRRSRNSVRAANADLARSNSELGRALAAKTEFLATTSHEIRTPLNGILGMTQVMMADAGTAPAVRERLAVVHGAGVTMRALVDDILDVAKIETGRMTVEAVPIDLAATIADAAAIWREQARAKGLAFTLDLDDCPGWIVGDAGRLRQIVFNLLSNAVKFTAAGHVALAARACDGRVIVTVADSGIGIAADAHELIFESFRQADAGTTRQFGGTGLGLSICRNLSRAMHGDVRVESALGCGALFTLDLPLIDATPASVAAEDVAVLVVDRNPIGRAMYRTLFAAHGDVAFADDVAQAAAALRSWAVGRVLVDAACIDDDAAAIALLLDAAGQTPVTLLTPALDPVRRAALLASGLAAVIERPVAKKDLVARVMADGDRLVSRAA